MVHNLKERFLRYFISRKINIKIKGEIWENPPCCFLLSHVSSLFWFPFRQMASRKTTFRESWWPGRASRFPDEFWPLLARLDCVSAAQSSRRGSSPAEARMQYHLWAMALRRWRRKGSMEETGVQGVIVLIHAVGKGVSIGSACHVAHSVSYKPDKCDYPRVQARWKRPCRKHTQINLGSILLAKISFLHFLGKLKSRRPSE
jgi:hypothetical protein